MAKTLIGNIKGKDGRGISKIEKTATTGSVDTYTIAYTDDTTSTFDVNNSDSVALQRQIVPSAAVESSATASQAYAEGDYVVVSGVLRKVTAAIAKGNAISDSNSTATTVAGELDTLGDSVSARVLYSDDSWRVVSFGVLCIAIAINVTVNGKGWTVKACPYILPVDKRPKKQLQAPGYAYPSANARIVIGDDTGKISVGSGDANSINSSICACIVWMAGV